MSQVKSKSSTRATPRPQKATKASPEDSALQGLSPEEARKVVQSSIDAAVETVRAATPRTLGPLQLGQIADATVVNEIGESGLAFGSFIESVGMGVAKAQGLIDANLVTTAEALSECEIDVIATFTQTLNDADGKMGTSEVQIQKLPLINYLMPTAYEWTRVFIRAETKVDEFNSASGFNIKAKSSSFGVAANASYSRKKGVGASGSIGYGTSSSELNVESQYQADSAAGTMLIEATLEPSKDVQLPKPFILQKGPRLNLAVTSIESLDAGGAPTLVPANVKGKRVTISAELLTTDGSANGTKDLAVKISEPTLVFKTRQPGGTTATPTTDSNGKLTIEVDRTGAVFDPTKPLSVVVEVRFGLVMESVEITL